MSVCGICGFVNFNGKPASQEILGKMMGTMVHRGPDDAGSYVSGSLALGFRRLQVIDPLYGKQPLVSEDGSLVLVCNGEIYNYLELRRELALRGHRFRSRGDAEVILHLYEEEGPGCLAKLRGMFAFVLWDSRRRLLFGARDHFGIKPFYYLLVPEGLAFASEIKALLEIPHYVPAVEEAALVHYLTFQYVPDPLTMFSGIYSLPAAHFFTLREGRIRVERYWQASFAPELQKPLEYFLEGIRINLRESVKLHARSDVPLGAFLSGGIDSAIIAALLRERGPLRTFSVGYEEERYSELKAARETAEFLETEHEEYIITPGDFLEQLPRLLWHFDQPLADPAAVSLYFVARQAAPRITVTLSGEGADEVFGGYGIYREPSSLDCYRRLPHVLRSGIGLASRLLPPGAPGRNYIRRATTPLAQRYVGNAYIFSPLQKERLLAPDLANPSPTVVTREYFEAASSWEEITTMQYIDIHTWLPGDILMKADRMTMANSLELRVPYLDHRLFEFAATIPARFKVCGRTTKLALRRAFRDIVPPRASRRPKRGFPVPTRCWLRGAFAPLMRELVEDPCTAEWFRRDFLRSLLDEHLGERRDNSRALWTVTIFLLWYKVFFLHALAPGDSLKPAGKGGRCRGVQYSH